MNFKEPCPDSYRDFCFLAPSGSIVNYTIALYQEKRKFVLFRARALLQILTYQYVEYNDRH